jgi:hypothetical protein
MRHSRGADLGNPALVDSQGQGDLGQSHLFVVTHLQFVCRVLNREERIGLSVPVDQERRRRTAAEALNLFLVRVEESVK